MMKPSKRVQMYFPYATYGKLKQESKARGRSIAHIVRRAVEEYLKSDKSDWDDDPLQKIVGMCNLDVKDASINHDKYIYGWSKSDDLH